MRAVGHLVLSTMTRFVIDGFGLHALASARPSRKAIMNRTRRKAVSSRRSCFRNNGQRTSRMLRLLMEQLESRRVLATVTVNANSDINDGDTSSIAALINAPGVDGLISLREAILAANNTLNVDGPDADTNADPDQIHFNIPGGGVQSITTNSDLPVITEAVIVDGYTQPGASPNTKQIGSDAVLMVEVFSSNTSLGFSWAVVVVRRFAALLPTACSMQLL